MICTYSECSALKNVNVEAVIQQASQLILDYIAMDSNQKLLLNLDEDKEEDHVDKFTDMNTCCLPVQTAPPQKSTCNAATQTISGKFILVDPDESYAASGCLEKNCWFNTTFCNLF